MKKFTFLLSLGAAFTTVSFAQAPAPEGVGLVTRVEGLATVSQGDTLGNVFKDEVILQNARVVTTATGSTTIRLNNGCVIVLMPNQAVTVDARRECKALLAAIQPAGAVGVAGAGVVVAGGVGAAGVPPGLGNAFIVGGGVFTGVGLIRAISNSNENSALQRLSGS